MRLMIRLSVAKIPFGMVLADDMSLDTESCQLWICQRNNDFWENTKYISLQWHLNNRCLLMVIFEICDGF